MRLPALYSYRYTPFLFAQFVNHSLVVVVFFGSIYAYGLCHVRDIYIEHLMSLQWCTVVLWYDVRWCMVSGTHFVVFNINLYNTLYSLHCRLYSIDINTCKCSFTCSLPRFSFTSWIVYKVYVCMYSLVGIFSVERIKLIRGHNS